MPSRVSKATRIANDDVTPLIVIPCLQDVHDAAYRIAHEFPGGVPALAQRMGVSPNTLNAKVSLNIDTHHTNLREAVHMQHVAQRFDILHAMSAALGHIAVPMPGQGTGMIDRKLSRVGAEVGDVFRQAEEALQDGELTLRERQALTKEIHEAIAALCGVLREL